MATEFQIGQIFAITNPDYHTSSERWTVIAAAYPSITFSYDRSHIVDMAYARYSSSGTAVGTVIADDDRGAILALSQFESHEPGLWIKGGQATYLISLDPPQPA